jgi:Stigma-specific protein, Stig1
MNMLRQLAALGLLAPLALIFGAQGCSKPCNDLNEICGRCGDQTYADQCKDIVNEANEDVCSQSVVTFQTFCNETGEGGSGAASGGCSNGQAVCGGVCVDTNSSPNACGNCLTQCSGDTALCAAGVCVASCPAAQPDECNGGCVDLGADANNCGGCGTVCADGEVCNDGACAAGCDTGETACDGACVDLASNTLHCGGCGTSCSGAFCSGGTCNSTCGNGLVECEGTCIDVTSDPSNCGGCGNAACVAPTDKCEAGACTDACSPALTDCGGACIDITSDATNCGGCGTICPNGAPCVGGACSSSGCPAGQTDCNGTCVDMNKDPNNCGECGTTCNVAGGQVCSLGGCADSCDLMFMECPDGSCVDVASDPDNCGACGNACAAGQACEGSACVANCSAGMSNCSGACVDLNASTLHCGNCGVSCGDGSVCTVDACTAGLCDNQSGALSCNDNNVCTDPDCDPVAGCTTDGSNALAKTDLEAICQQTQGIDPTTNCVYCDPFGEQCNVGVTGALCAAGYPQGNTCAVCSDTVATCVGDNNLCTNPDTCVIAVVDQDNGTAMCQ